MSDDQKEEFEEALSVVGRDLFAAYGRLLEEQEDLEQLYNEIKHKREVFNQTIMEKQQSIEYALLSRLDGKSVAELTQQAKEIIKERNAYVGNYYEEVMRNRAAEAIDAARQERNEAVLLATKSLEKIKDAVPEYKREEFLRAAKDYYRNKIIHHESPAFALASIKIDQHLINYADAIVDGQLDEKSVDELIAAYARINQKALEE